LNFFEKTLKNMQTALIFCKVWFLLKKLGKIQCGFQTCCTSSFLQRTLDIFKCKGEVEVDFLKSGVERGFFQNVRLEVGT
jgi:hypothetical protein